MFKPLFSVLTVALTVASLSFAYAHPTGGAMPPPVQTTGVSGTLCDTPENVVYYLGINIDAESVADLIPIEGCAFAGPHAGVLIEYIEEIVVGNAEGNEVHIPISRVTDWDGNELGYGWGSAYMHSHVRPGEDA